MKATGKRRVAVTNIPGMFQTGIGIVLLFSGLGFIIYKLTAGHIGLAEWLYIALGGILIYFAALCFMASKIYFDLDNRRYKKETIFFLFVMAHGNRCLSLNMYLFLPAVSNRRGRKYRRL